MLVELKGRTFGGWHVRKLRERRRDLVICLFS